MQRALRQGHGAAHLQTPSPPLRQHLPSVAIRHAPRPGLQRTDQATAARTAAPPPPTSAGCAQGAAARTVSPPGSRLANPSSTSGLPGTPTMRSGQCPWRGFVAHRPGRFGGCSSRAEVRCAPALDVAAALHHPHHQPGADPLQRAQQQGRDQGEEPKSADHERTLSRRQLLGVADELGEEHDGSRRIDHAECCARGPPRELHHRASHATPPPSLHGVEPRTCQRVYGPQLLREEQSARGGLPLRLHTACIGHPQL